MDKIRVITLFSGYDSQCLALNRLRRDNAGFDYELVAWCEIDKNAIKGHDALFPQWADRNVGDVSKVDWEQWRAEHPGEIDLLTYSSPCQDFSSAGLQRGGAEGSGTRSGLLWEVERCVAALRPKALVFENVANLVSYKFIDVFNAWQSRLNGYGYTNFQQLMNAKDYGVPQNRLRIFMVSVLDCDRAYYFPQPFRLERRLKDVLEPKVDERYYLSEKAVERLMKNMGGGSDNDPDGQTEQNGAGELPQDTDIRQLCGGEYPPQSGRQASKYYRMTKDGNIEARDKDTGQRHTEEVFINPENVCPTVITVRPPMIIENE